LEAFQLWSYHQALSDPRDDCLHALHSKFLRTHPQFDVTKAEDLHNVCSEMGHDSSHATLSDYDGHNIMLTPDSRLVRHRNLDGGIPKLYHMICDGPYAMVTMWPSLVSAPCFESCIRSIVDIQQHTNPKERTDTREEEPFVLRAHLKDVMTGDHKDSGDWHTGMPSWCHLANSKVLLNTWSCYLMSGPSVLRQSCERPG